MKQNIRERYKELTDTPAGKAAEMGDVLIANMKGFDRMPDGSKGEQNTHLYPSLPYLSFILFGPL